MRQLYKARSGLKHDGIFRKSTTISFHIPSYSIMYPHWLPFSFIGLHLPTWPFYTCRLFLRLKKAWDFYPGSTGIFKDDTIISEDSRRGPKSSEDVRSIRTRINAISLPVLFTSKLRDCEEGIVIYSFYTWFSLLTWVRVNIFLEIVSSKTAATHIFQSGVRNWPAGVSRREIEVFNPQGVRVGRYTVTLTHSKYLMHVKSAYVFKKQQRHQPVIE